MITQRTRKLNSAQMQKARNSVNRTIKRAVYAAPDEWQQLEMHCVKTNQIVSHIVRKLIQDYLNNIR